MKRAIFAALVGTTALIPAAAVAQTNAAGRQPAGQQAAQAGQIPASQLRNQSVYSQNGEELGRIASVVQGQDNRASAVVTSGNRQVLVPIDRFAYRGDRFVVNGADDELRFPAYNQQSAARYRAADPNYRVAIVGYDVDPVVAARRTADAANILVQQPAPTVTVDPADPRVTVRQPQPQVTVNQGQPEIIVRQPQPTVTVDIPQPEIVLRMPRPDVNVAMAQPQVSVDQPKPQVQVTRPSQPQVNVEPSQPQVLVQRPANAEPSVQVQRAEGQPNVRYERAEPRVVVNQAQGQPTVRIERQDQQANAGQTDRTLAAADRAHDRAGIVVNERGAGAGLNFASFDRDRNRTLTREEFNPFATRVYGGWDENQDRRLERDEFYGGLYGLWDFDRDQRLTQAEYDRAWGTWGAGTQRVEFGRFDRNRDGFLDRNEFAGGWGDNGLYERFDADRGGWLAENEFSNGLFGLWGGSRGQVAENDFGPWLGYNWGVSPVAGAAAGTVEPQREPAVTGALPGTTRGMRVVDLEDMDVYSLQGRKVGEVKRLVRGVGDDRQFVILEHGGFLGLGEKEVPLPLNRVFLRGDRLVAAGLTEAEVNQMPDWDMNSREYREFADNETVELGVRE